jgi:hypothetical protein
MAATYKTINGTPELTSCETCNRYGLVKHNDRPSICGDCRAIESRKVNGWTPENSVD